MRNTYANDPVSVCGGNCSTSVCFESRGDPRKAIFEDAEHDEPRQSNQEDPNRRDIPKRVPIEAFGYNFRGGVAVRIFGHARGFGAGTTRVDGECAVARS